MLEHKVHIIKFRANTTSSRQPCDDTWFGMLELNLKRQRLQKMHKSYGAISIHHLHEILVPAWQDMQEQWAEKSFHHVRLWPLADIPGYLKLKEKVDSGEVKCTFCFVLSVTAS